MEASLHPNIFEAIVRVVDDPGLYAKLALVSRGCYRIARRYRWRAWSIKCAKVGVLEPGPILHKICSYALRDGGADYKNLSLVSKDLMNFIHRMRREIKYNWIQDWISYAETLGDRIILVHKYHVSEFSRGDGSRMVIFINPHVGSCVIVDAADLGDPNVIGSKSLRYYATRQHQIGFLSDEERDMYMSYIMCMKHHNITHMEKIMDGDLCLARILPNDI